MFAFCNKLPMEQNPMFLCRICLKVGAIHPIFEVNGETCLLNKLSMCLNEKLEDVDGYPRYICEECKENLDILCSFIKKFKSTNIILQNGLHSQKLDFETENLNCLSEEEDLTNIEVEYVGYEVVNDHISDVSDHDDEEPLHNIDNRKKPMKSKSLTKNIKGTIKKPNTAASKTIKSSCMPPTKPKNNELARQCVETPAQIRCFPPASNIMSESSTSLHAALDSNKTRKCLVPLPINIKQETVQPVQVKDKNMYEYRGNAPGIDIVNSDVLTTHTHKETGKEYGEQQVSKTNKDILMATLNNLTSKLSSLESKVDNYAANNSKNQIIVTLNQEQIMQKLSEITAQFDEFIKRSSTFNLSQTEDLNKGIKNIHNEESLNAFEESLKNKQQLEEMKNIYSVVCGKGKGRAINNAYALLDVMFDRKFLKQCSWAGGSRGETAKLCFKSYKRVIDFFFYIIHTSDNQFTKMECETFLKNILKNATKRCESKYLRRPAQKIRQKKKELKPEDNESPELANEDIEDPYAAFIEEQESTIDIIPETVDEISNY